MLQDSFASAGAPTPEATTRAGLPEDTYNRLQARFLDEGDALLAAVTAPYRDFQDVAKRCHDLSGAAAIFGAHALHDILAQADTAGKQGNKRQFEELITQDPSPWPATPNHQKHPGPAR